MAAISLTITGTTPTNEVESDLLQDIERFCIELKRAHGEHVTDLAFAWVGTAVPDAALGTPKTVQ